MVKEVARRKNKRACDIPSLYDDGLWCWRRIWQWIWWWRVHDDDEGDIGDCLYLFLERCSLSMMMLGWHRGRNCVKPQANWTLCESFKSSFLSALQTKNAMRTIIWRPLKIQKYKKLQTKNAIRTLMVMIVTFIWNMKNAMWTRHCNDGEDNLKPSENFSLWLMLLVDLVTRLVVKTFKNSTAERVPSECS